MCGGSGSSGDGGIAKCIVDGHGDDGSGSSDMLVVELVVGMVVMVVITWWS